MGSLAAEFTEGIDEIFNTFYQDTVGLYLRDPDSDEENPVFVGPFTLLSGIKVDFVPETVKSGDETWHSNSVSFTVPHSELVKYGIAVDGQEAKNYLTKSIISHKTLGTVSISEVNPVAYVDDVFLIWKFSGLVVKGAELIETDELTNEDIAWIKKLRTIMKITSFDTFTVLTEG